MQGRSDSPRSDNGEDVFFDMLQKMGIIRMYNTELHLNIIIARNRGVSIQFRNSRHVTFVIRPVELPSLFSFEKFTASDLVHDRVFEDGIPLVMTVKHFVEKDLQIESKKH